MEQTITLSIVHDFFSQWAPQELASDWDNVGLQIGSYDQSVTECLIALEVDEYVCSYLETKKNVLVITHHPLFFKPLKQLNYNSDMGTIIRTFVKGDHCLYSAHTNLDAAKDGVNDCLIEHFGLNPEDGQVIDSGFGKYFEGLSLDFTKLSETLPSIQQGAMHNNSVKKLAFCAGSGHGLVSHVIQLKCDTFITGELNYHDHVTCRMNGVRILLLGHKESEDFICQRIKQRLQEHYRHLSIQCI